MKFKSMPIQMITVVGMLSYLYANTWPDQKLIEYSPAVILSTYFLLINLRKLLSNTKLLIALVAILLATGFGGQNFIECARFLVVVGGIYAISSISKPPSKFYLPVLIFFIIEFTMRFAHAHLDEINLYSLKGTYILFFDSNFVGLFLAFSMAGIVSSKNVVKYKYIFVAFCALLILTFSRNAWIVFATYLISIYSLRTGIFLLFLSMAFPFIVSIYGFDLGSIDGSFQTKQYIFKVFEYLLFESPIDLVFGLGRESPEDLAMQITGTPYSGHTLYGQIVQFGIVIISIFYYSAYLLAKEFAPNYKHFFIAALVGGFMGLSPTSYIGSLLFIYSIFQQRINS